MTTNPPERLDALLQEAASLRALALRLVAACDADDVVQDTWVATLRRPPDPARPAAPWLARLVHNFASNRRRAARRRRAHEDAVAAARAAAADGAADPSELAQAAALQRQLAAAIAALPAPLRDVIVLCHFHGLDSTAAGRRLGIAASAVRTRHQRALDALRRALDEQPGGRAAWLAAARALPGASDAAVAAVPWLGRAMLALGGAAAAVVVTAFAGVFSGDTVPTEHESARLAMPAPASAGALGDERVDTAAPVRTNAGPGGYAIRTDVAAALEPAGRARAEDAGTATIRGHVRVDGAPPRFDLQLRLLEADDARALAAGDRERRRAVREATVPIDARGAFTFDALPVGWQGAVFADTCVAPDGSPSLAVQAPSEGLWLDFRGGPAVTGTIVVPDGGPRDVPGQCAFYPTIAPGYPDGLEVVPFRCAPDGSFVVPIRARGSLASMVVRIEVDGRAFLHHATSRRDAERGIELGTLTAEPVRDVTLFVVDALGVAIPDARATIAGDSLVARVALADERGVIRMASVPRRQCTLRVEASELGTCELGAPATGTAVVTLVPTGRLAVSLGDVLRGKARSVRFTGAPRAIRNVPRQGDKLPDFATDVQPAPAPLGAAAAWTAALGASPILLVEVAADTEIVVEAIGADGDVLARANAVVPAGKLCQLPLSPR